MAKLTLNKATIEQLNTLKGALANPVLLGDIAVNQPELVALYTKYVGEPTKIDTRIEEIEANGIKIAEQLKGFGVKVKKDTLTLAIDLTEIKGETAKWDRYGHAQSLQFFKFTHNGMEYTVNCDVLSKKKA